MKERETTVGVALTALQRESLLAYWPHFRAAHGRLAGRRGNVQSVPFTLRELDALAAEVAFVAWFARSPHTRRLAAVLRRVEAAAARRRRYDDWYEAATAPPPVPGPEPGLVFQFRVALVGVSPPIWRQIQVEDCDLFAFHHTIREVMGWTDDFEPHAFEVGGRAIGPRTWQSVDLPQSGDDERAVYLHELFVAGKAAAGSWLYDPGRGWRHDLVYEGVIPWDFDTDYPTCLDGGGACPPEGAGGPAAYQRYLDGDAPLPAAAVRDLGNRYSSFDPAAFDVAALNARLADLPTLICRWREGWMC